MANNRPEADSRERAHAPLPFGPRRGSQAMQAIWGQTQHVKDVRGTARRLVRYLRAYPLALAMVIASVALSTAFNLAGPFLLGRAIDLYVIPGEIPGIVKIALVMAGVYLCSAAATWFQTWQMVGVSQRVLRQIRQDVFFKLQGLSLAFFDSRPHGEIMSRLINDVENINNVFTQAVTQLLSSVLTTIGVVIVMFSMDPGLAGISLVTIPLVLVISRSVAARTRRGFREQQQNLGRLNGLIEETITGQKVVRAYCREETAIAQFEEANSEYRRSAINAQIFASVIGPTMNLVNNIGFAIVAGAGGWLALSGAATVGTVAAFINYSRQLARPINEMANLYAMIQSALAGAERIFEVLDETSQIQDADGATELRGVQGQVRFRGVSFGYRENEPVLRGVSFEAKPGSLIALVGPTGAGKTTIVNLLTRFYDLNSGNIEIDGRDIRQVTQDSLRRCLGIVLQDTFLFSASVADNIRYGRLDARDEEVHAAAKLANADGFIQHLPQGYDTMLSEQASNLSQGQRQLLAIARAALAEPSMLILDEATSSVDTLTEAHIQQAMLRLMKGRTSFVIAHRLSTIRAADVILVINDGRIIERGTHESLLAAKGFYHDLYVSQFRGLAAEHAL
jgi:ATP-binding cassette subfamily B multidrug efflux pump